MEKELTIKIKIKQVDKFDDLDKIACIYYPNEGNIIKIIKGLNVIELSDSIHHEIGHLMDWYISEGNQSNDVNIREKNANIIGDSIRYKCNS